MSLKKEKVSTAVTALFKISEKLKEKSLLDEVEVIQLQISLSRVPPKEKRFKLKLPHGLRHEKTDVCLFVKDLDGGKDREYEPTKSHFEEMFSKHNINSVVEIIPLKSLKLEYKPYEAKRNLSNAYDIFLADARIIRLLPSILGKHFFGRKKLPIQVNLEAKKLKEEVDGAINNSRCVIGNRGSSSTTVIANLDMAESDVVENVMSSVTQIGNGVPGGWINVKQLSLKTNKSPSIPIYMSSVCPQDVTIAREDKSEKVEAEEISTLFGAKVKVYPNGIVKVIKDGEEDNEDAPRKKRKKKSLKKVRSVPSVTKSPATVISATKKIIASSTVRKSPVNSITRKRLAKATTKENPAKATAKKLPAKATAKKLPAKSITKKSPVKSSTKKSPAKSATKKSPAKSATKKSPTKSATKTAVNTPVRASKRKLPS